MNPAIVGALISAGSALVSGAAQNRAAKKANDRSFAQTKQLFGMQQQDRDFQNAYGSPAQSIARLKAAGLSPASFYGNPSAAGVSTGVASPGSPEVSTPDIAGAIQSGASAGNVALLSGAQKENLESQTSKNNAEMIKALTENARGEFELKLAKDLRENTLARAQADLENTIQNTATQKAQEILSGVDAAYRRVGMYVARSQVRLNEKQLSLWDKEMEKLGVDMSEARTRMALNRANTAVAEQTAREICFSIEHMMPAMVADYAASADLKTTQAWDSQENAKFQQWYNENMLDYLPTEIKSKIANMDADTRMVTQQNIRNWIKLPAEFVRDAGVGIGAVAQPISQLLGPGRARIGF